MAERAACGVLTGWGAVTNTVDFPAGATAVVIGAGGVGLNAIQTLARRGAASLTRRLRRVRAARTSASQGYVDRVSASVWQPGASRTG